MFEGATSRLRVSEGRIGRFLIACMALGFLSLLAAGIAAAWSTGRSQDHGRWVNHTYEVEIAIRDAGILIEQGETTRRGYLLSGQPVYLDAYREVTSRQPAALARVAELTSDNPEQVQAFAVLRARIADVVAQRDHSIALIAAGRRDQAIADFANETGARRMRGIRDQASAMVQTEQRLLAIRDRELRDSITVFYVILAVAAVLLLLVALISLAVVLRYTRDLSASRDTVQRFAESLEDQVADRTADLTRANEEIQRFAYIVSHDLRSPLVNVMGFTAELEAATGTIGALIDRVDAQAPAIVTEDDRIAAREELPEAIGFIRTSTQKMDRLINAILKLSREGRRVLTPEPVEVGALVAQIRGSLQHQLDDREATIEVQEPLPGVTVDRFSLEQILSNLIENAVKYLDPARAGHIVVSGERRGPRVSFAIADNGRGIDARDHQRIFDLFRRSGRQDQPGEGIGLAHVRALALRLGGTIDVTSELGKGATFRLTLPATPGDQESRTAA